MMSNNSFHSGAYYPPRGCLVCLVVKRQPFLHHITWGVLRHDEHSFIGLVRPPSGGGATSPLTESNLFVLGYKS
jgi:hypothetical protein